MDSIVTLNLKVDEARAKVKARIFKEVNETFQIDILTEAKQGSPVKTGHNRRTIDAEVEQKPEGVRAQVFTQSGYGGYLETGTRKMKARPYMYPAFQAGMLKLAARLKRIF